jgi:hypothetical protein
MSKENHGGMVSTRGNSLLVHQSVLWKSYQQSHLVANQEDLDEGNDGNEIYLSYFVQFFNTPSNLTTWGLWLYFPP